MRENGLHRHHFFQRISVYFGPGPVDEKRFVMPVDEDARKRAFDQIAELLFAVLEGALGPLAPGDAP